MMLYNERLESEEADDWYMWLTEENVITFVAPRVAKAVRAFGDGVDADVHTREIQALLMFVEGRL